MQAPRIFFYYAKVEKVGPEWRVHFPDLPDLTPCGRSFWDALARAETALNAWLETDSEQGSALPIATDYRGNPEYFPIPVRARILQAYLGKGDPRA